VNANTNAAEVEINTQSLKSGIYIIQIKSDNFVKSGKLIITN
jgi:hypothetical protein